MFTFARAMLLLLMMGASISAARAHDGRPLYIEVEQKSAVRYDVRWRIPSSIAPRFAPDVAVVSGCKHIGNVAQVETVDALERKVSYQCPNAGARTLVIRYDILRPAVAALVRYTGHLGDRHTAMLAPDQSAWEIPSAQTHASVAQAYAWLGLQHIWAGFDHLLFVACLMWVAGTWRRVLATVTGFTLAHSATLALSALQVVQVAAPPVEATIALSIVLVGAEVVRGPASSSMWRHPFAFSLMFGLLHGLGFAAALNEIGLPRAEIVTGLLFFNVGLEVGQILFVGALGFASRIVARFAARVFAQGDGRAAIRTAVGYISGAQAVFWLLDRVSQF